MGYSGTHWINKQISFWTRNPINHVGIRFYGSKVGPVEYYHDVISGPKLMRSASVEHFFRPLEYSYILPVSREQYEACGKVCMDYPVGKISASYRYHFLGGDAPPTCTRMVAEQLTILGYPVAENFMPGKLIEEFKERYMK